ncbi:MAG TPA: hypothetical protein VFJ74_15605 [Gemmatimonadaceae bacterium]|nr:hypothetical protein [Gemmatimonadaceae bacterium]
MLTQPPKRELSTRVGVAAGAAARHGVALVGAGIVALVATAAWTGAALPRTPGGWARGAVAFGVALVIEEGLIAGFMRGAERLVRWARLDEPREPPRVVPRRQRPPAA